MPPVHARRREVPWVHVPHQVLVLMREPGPFSRFEGRALAAWSRRMGWAFRFRPHPSSWCSGPWWKRLSTRPTLPGRRARGTARPTAWCTRRTDPA